MFKEYKGLDLTGLSAEVLEDWKRQDVFHKTLEMRDGSPEYVFSRGLLRQMACRAYTM